METWARPGLRLPPVLLRTCVGVSGPEGAKQESPGQRPGNQAENCPPQSPYFSALKGQNRSCTALSGRIHINRHQYPGRCPGLSCLAPSGPEERTSAQQIAPDGPSRISGAKPNFSSAHLYPALPASGIMETP